LSIGFAVNAVTRAARVPFKETRPVSIRSSVMTGQDRWNGLIPSGSENPSSGNQEKESVL
jgi:hypothetical protein